MIAAWMLYCSLCALGLMLAGVLAERLLLAGRAPVRVVWIGALLLSIVLPVVAFRVSSSRQPTTTVALPQATTMSATTVAVVADSETALPGTLATPSVSWRTLVDKRLHDLDTPLLIVWAAFSVALAISFAGGVIALAWMRRRWEERVVQGVTVYVSRRTGPAVVGAIAPTIVIPEWALSLPSSQLSLMLRHELEHLRARDGQLLIAAQIALIAMPWNVALWWQVLRLRVAIEMDCDARVLRVADARSYGELLLEVARPHRSFKLAGMIAFAERAAQLERRIRFLRRHRDATSKRAMIAASTVALVALSVAWVAPHPAGPARVATILAVPSVSSLPIVAMHDAATKPASPIVVPTVHAARLAPTRRQECANDTSVVGSTFRFIYGDAKLSRDNQSKACELLVRLADEQLAEDAVAQATMMNMREQRAAVQSQRNAALGSLLTTDADRATFVANMSRLVNATAPTGAFARGRVSGGGSFNAIAPPPPGGIGGGAMGGGRVGRGSFSGDSIIVQSAAMVEHERRLKNALADFRARGERANMQIVTTNDGGMVNTVTRVSMDTASGSGSNDPERAAADRAKVEAILVQTAGVMTYQNLFKDITLSPDGEAAAKKIIDDAQTAMNHVGRARAAETRLRVDHGRGVAMIVSGADTTLVDLAPSADRAAVRARIVAAPQ